MKTFPLSTERMTIKEALREAVLALQAAHVETASLDARMLLEHLLGTSREQLLMRMDDRLSSQQDVYYRELIAMRASRKPISQMIGKREFFGIDFTVNGSVLDPRPDSETLIEAILKRFSERDMPLRILDLGTGSGCLLLTLLRLFPNASGVGVDISSDALNVAEKNALSLELKHRAMFMQSHWCMKVEGTFDIIISNPPYIPSAEIDYLAPEVKNFEPRLALDGGMDGLNCYRAVVASLPRHLAKNGIAVLELGLGQQHPVGRLAIKNGLKPAGIVNDIQGIARALILTQ